MGTNDHAVFQDHNHAVIILGEFGTRGIPNTKADKDMKMVDLLELSRLVDAVEKFIVSSDKSIRQVLHTAAASAYNRRFI